MKRKPRAGVEGNEWSEEEKEGWGERAVSTGGLSERLVAWPEGETVNGSQSAGRTGGCGC